MSNQTSVPSVSLQTAVLEQVKYFANTNLTFSAHDVTRSIRTKVAKGELEIPETEVQGASFKNDIRHSTVKGIFEELWRTGVFDPFLTLTRNFNGTYFEYKAILNSSTMFPPPMSPTYSGPSASVNNTAPTSMFPSQMNLVINNNDDDIIKARIQTYLENCSKKNFRPTIKQVQSAIKRSSSSGWYCDQIYEYIQTELKYEIVDNPEFISASQVITA